jgi:D-glycero-alpha-D-manno-heptose 1-phosphate guanylyltransferase
MIDVVILAGGKGTRMGEDVSKPLVLTRGREIIAWQLDNLYRNYPELINKVVLALSFKAETVKEFVAQKYSDKQIEISIETEPLGTGGGIKQAMKQAVADWVLVFNVDDITDIDLNDFSEVRENKLAVVNPILPFGLIENVDGYAQFREKPVLTDLWVSCGWYLLNRAEVLEKFPDSGSVEYDVFQKGLVKLKVYSHRGFWAPLNSKKELDNFVNSVLSDKLKNL